MRKVRDAVSLLTFTNGIDRDVGGAICRIVPPPDFGAPEKEQLRQVLLRQGAVHVWFTAPANRTRVVTKRAARPAPKVESVNEAAEAMLLEARSENLKRLRELVQRFLGEAGA